MIQKGDMVNVKSRNPRLRDGEVLGDVWVHMGADGNDIGRWALIKFPLVDNPVAIPASFLEVV